MHQKRVKNTLLTIVFAFAVLFTSVEAQSSTLGNCIEYSGGVCIRCDIQSHLFGQICYKNILGCLRYQTGNICIECDNTNFILVQGSCNVSSGVTITPDLQATLYKYGGDTNPGDQYGQSGFIPTTLDTVQKWPTFLAVYTFMRVGQYSHYISRTANPIYSVHYYTKGSSTNSSSLTYSYKILYHGSGGGLFLLIADVPPNLNVQVRALNVIASSNVIDYCVDYGTADSSCLRCGDQYHLENKVCYANIGGCIKYTENICLECFDYYFLVENRCVSDCLAVSDARSILYFNNNQNKSTLQTYYGVSTKSFYSVTVTTVTTITTTTTTTTTRGGGAIMLPSGISSSEISGFGISSGMRTSGQSSSSSTGMSSSTNIGSSSSGSGSSSNSGSSSGITLITGSGSNSGSSSSTSSSSQQSSSSGSSGSSNRTSIGGFDASSISLAPSSSSTLVLNSSNSSSLGNGASSTRTIFSSTTTTTTFNSSSSAPSSTSSSFTSQSSSLNPISSLSSSSSSSSSSLDPNCNTYNNGICTVCSQFYYFNKATNICTMVSPFCATYSKTTGQCLTCFPGFDLSNEDCVVADA